MANKHCITTALIISVLLSGCVTYKDRDTGEWMTYGFLEDIPGHTESIRLTVEVSPDAYEKCRAPACTINGTAHIQGKPQNVTMSLSAEFINSLPNDEGRAGDILADKLGLDLEFNRRSNLGHEALRHVFSNTHTHNNGTPNVGF